MGFGARPAKVEALERRVKALEEKVFKSKRKELTLAQRIIAFSHLGLLDKIRELEISNQKKADLVALLVNGDASNTKGIIESLARKDGTESVLPNQRALLEVYQALGLENQAKETQKKILQLEKDYV